MTAHKTRTRKEKERPAMWETEMDGLPDTRNGWLQKNRNRTRSRRNSGGLVRERDANGARGGEAWRIGWRRGTRPVRQNQVRVK